MDTYDIVGLGFGPSNIATAIAARERAPELHCRFYDAQEAFSWHAGLMFPMAEMQVPFLKDLVTTRNPSSDFTFLRYLEARGRLHEFINLRTFYPTRVEFNDYYQWVASQFADEAHYGQRVTHVKFADRSQEVLDVELVSTSSGSTSHIQTRNLVVAAGGVPYVPAGIAPSARVIHASNTLPTLSASFSDISAPYRFCVVGAGQTTADLFTYLSTVYPNATIDVSLRGFAMLPEDDTHFVNELFAPETVDWFQTAPDHLRKEVLHRHANAAHSGASYDLIPRIYRAQYESRVAGQAQYRFHRFRDVVRVEEAAHEAEVVFRSRENGAEIRETHDLVIFATGYRYPGTLPELGGVESSLEKRAGRYLVGRNYRVRSSAAAGIYLQGYAEASHGFSEVLLSLMPQRAADIVASVLQRKGATSAAGAHERNHA